MMPADGARVRRKDWRAAQRGIPTGRRTGYAEPSPQMTTRERYVAGFEPRDNDERTEYGELARCDTPTLVEPHPEKYSYEASVNGDYPAVIHEPGQCAACDASAAYLARLNSAVVAA